MCGEGGALLANYPRFHSHATVIREKGTNRTDFMLSKVSKYEWMSLGSSYVSSELCSAFLLPQLLDAEESAFRRHRVCHAYRTLLAPLVAQGLFRFAETLGHGVGAGVQAKRRGNGHNFPLIFPSADIRKAVQTAMTAQQVQCLTHFVPLHLSQGGSKYGKVMPQAPWSARSRRRCVCCAFQCGPGCVLGTSSTLCRCCTSILANRFPL